MGIILGIIIYLAVLAGFILFGRFLHECDEHLHRAFKKRSA